MNEKRNRPDARPWCGAGMLGAAVSGAIAFGWGCGSNSLEPSHFPRPASYGAGDVYIEVHMTGGIAGIDVVFAVDGSARLVRGISCGHLCDFDPNAEILHLSAAQVVQLSGLLVDAGAFEADGTDFGVQCCDQFHYAVTFRIGDRESRFQGSSEVLPPALGSAMATIVQLVEGTVPVIVDFDSEPHDWPQDALTLGSHSLAGNYLTLEVEYSGGCTGHVLDLVAHGGWMESFPVQVSVLLTHDDRDDACDGLIRRNVEFDLRTLRDAYVESYGAGEPGTTTIIMRLTVPDGAEPRPIEYVF